MKLLLRVLFFLFPLAVAHAAGTAFYVDRTTIPLTKNAITSALIHFEEPMDRAVLSWDPVGVEKATLTFQLRARQPNGQWGRWWTMGIWGEGARSVKGQKSQEGSVDIDTLLLNQPATDWQYRVTVKNPAKQVPQLSAMALSAKNSKTYKKELGELPRHFRPLSVPVFSQYEEAAKAGRPDMGKRICSPTSVAMTLRYLGVSIPSPLLVADQVYDPTGDVYGNWPFNTAGLYTQIVKSFDWYGITYVRWFDQLSDLLPFIQKGNPVIVSVGFKEGELKGAFKPTPGHLMVVRGMDQKYVYVNDPAAPNAKQVARKYPTDEFLKAWKGVAYVIE